MHQSYLGSQDGLHEDGRGSVMSGSIASRRILLAASAAIGLVAAPAYGWADAPVANEQAAGVGSSSTGQKAKPGATTKYCMIEEGTGSRIPKKVCRTREQWDELGVELPAK